VSHRRAAGIAANSSYRAARGLLVDAGSTVAYVAYVAGDAAYAAAVLGADSAATDYAAEAADDACDAGAQPGWVLEQIMEIMYGQEENN